jgi:hypothetical protein
MDDSGILFEIRQHTLHNFVSSNADNSFPNI